MDSLPAETLHLAKGRTADITLKDLSTAGYAWSYSLDGDASTVVIQKDFTAVNDAAKKLQGSNADITFTIKAIKTGTVILHFVQKRSWGKDDLITQKDVTVIIN